MRWPLVLGVGAVAIASGAGGAVLGLALGDSEDGDEPQISSGPDPTNPTRAVRFAAPEEAKAFLGPTCPEWSPQRHGDSGVDLDAAVFNNGSPNGWVLAQAGTIRLVNPLGDPGGYGSLGEADSVAVSAVRVYKFDRWLVVEHAGRYYPFEGTLYEPYITTTTPGAYDVPHTEYEANERPAPCAIDPSQGRVVAWHAADTVILNDQLDYAPIRFDWIAPGPGTFTGIGA